MENVLVEEVQTFRRQREPKKPSRAHVAHDAVAGIVVSNAHEDAAAGALIGGVVRREDRAPCREIDRRFSVGLVGRAKKL